jgi:ferredoxin-NADP reductase
MPKATVLQNKDLSGRNTAAHVDPAIVPGGRRRAFVRAMTFEAKGVLSVTLTAPDGGSPGAWQPGAHIDVLPGAGLVAQYSLCGPLAAPYWKIAVLLDRQGRGTSRFIHERLRPGSTIEIGGPRNNFPLLPAERYQFVAGGIGITPFLPMIEAAGRNARPWRLAYGGRSAAGMGFLDALAGHGDAVALYPQDSVGLLPVAKIVGQLEEDCAIYCCGPEPLIEALQSELQRQGKALAYVERFGAKRMELPSGGGGFHVVLARSGRKIWVPPDKSIVEALAEAGISVPTSCRQGVCGSCETGVLAGGIDHRDDLLSEKEKKEGRTMLVCVSRALGDVITLDL